MSETVKPKIHELKSWPVYFNAVVKGYKTFEVRYNDRDFQVGDMLDLREWDPVATIGDKYTGRRIRVVVQHMAKPEIGDHAVLGLQRDWCIMSIKPYQGG